MTKSIRIVRLAALFAGNYTKISLQPVNICYISNLELMPIKQMTEMHINTSQVLRFLLRTLILLVAWWVISGGNPASWWIGLPAVVIAVISSHLLLPATNINWYELFKFAPYFIVRSLVGGIDVARRASHIKLPISPALIEYPLRLHHGLPQVFFINTVSLLPGTLIADSQGNTLKVHVLDETSEFIDEVRSIEQRIAKIFTVTLADSDNGIEVKNESI